MRKNEQYTGEGGRADKETEAHKIREECQRGERSRGDNEREKRTAFRSLKQKRETSKA